MGILTEKSLETIDARISELKVPSDIARLAGKISSCYKNYKADE